MSEREETSVVELLLREPEIIAWLDDYRPLPETAEDDEHEPPNAA
ncbi:MAG TPA: hypothetical protein VGN06_09330 [Gaiellaceae bacterium]|jgi:hypothetical protein